MSAGRARKPAAGWLVGVGGPSVEVPCWAADWLERQTDVALRRVALRGVDPAVDEVLIALRHAAMQWRGSDAGSDPGTSLVDELTVDGSSVVHNGLCTEEAGRLIGISDRAVRRAIADRRLPARMVGGRWVVDEQDARRYRDDRRRAA